LSNRIARMMTSLSDRGTARSPPPHRNRIPTGTPTTALFGLRCLCRTRLSRQLLEPLSAEKVYDEEAHAHLAYETAVQGSALLKNRDAVLPLKPGARVALIGPLRSAKWQMLGSYSSLYNSEDWEDSPNVVSAVEGLQDCELVGELVLPDGGPTVCSPSENAIPGVESAVEKPDADVVVIVAGARRQFIVLRACSSGRAGKVLGKCQAGCLESEGCDRLSLMLSPGQQLLLKRAESWGLPVVSAVAPWMSLSLPEPAGALAPCCGWAIPARLQERRLRTCSSVGRLRVASLRRPSTGVTVT